MNVLTESGVIPVTVILVVYPLVLLMHIAVVKVEIIVPMERAVALVIY